MTKRLIDILKEYDKTKIAFHMPGHHRNLDFYGEGFLKDLGANMDVTEVEGLDNLHQPEGILKESMERAASLWKAKGAYYLVNGSSGGNLAALYTILRRKDRVLLARNCHKSVYHCLELMDLDVQYINPKIDRNFGISLGIEVDDVEEKFKKFPDIKLLVLTSPTYEGVISDIGAISELCKKYGVKLFVDEAHGAHLGLSPYFPKSAIEEGADLVVKSLHKSLASLTQTAILLENGEIDRERLKHALSIFQTSSPSYLFMASIDANVDLLLSKGEEIFGRWRDNLEEFYRMTENLRHLKIPYDTVGGFERDLSKILIFTGRTNMSAKELAGILRESYNIETEMVSKDYLIAYTGVGIDINKLTVLAKALADIDRNLQEGSLKVYEDIRISQESRSISSALSEEKILVSLEEALGRESAEYVWIYPPGVPFLLPGQLVGVEELKLLSSYKDADMTLRFSGSHDENSIYIVANK